MADVTRGPYEARYLPEGAPAEPLKYGVVSLSEGIEVCRVWKEQDARAITDALTRPASPSDGEAVRKTTHSSDDARKFIIETIRANFDPPPNRHNTGWNDGAEEIADLILARMRGAAVPQPISTATKDDSSRLLYFPEETSSAVGWIEGWWHEDTPEETGWETVIGFIGEPTHWLPCPAAPEPSR